ncbi:hypothetical protein B0T14DRAFT_101751 [Immersiella caudata]|uniref:Uncharacterized protein n=1 Tax=Immersiella caudata TaxID=314043 RepID=A0AA39X359_9PEZI|nr:hypothetical protein B0T14DRAFT_101751 [Immersiella caudata]
MSFRFHRTKVSTPVLAVVSVVFPSGTSPLGRAFGFKTLTFPPAISNTPSSAFDAIFASLSQVISFRGFFRLPSHNNIRSSYGEQTKTVGKGRNVKLMTMNEERYPNHTRAFIMGRKGTAGGGGSLREIPVCGKAYTNWRRVERMCVECCVSFELRSGRPRVARTCPKPWERGGPTKREEERSGAKTKTTRCLSGRRVPSE